MIVAMIAAGRHRQAHELTATSIDSRLDAFRGLLMMLLVDLQTTQPASITAVGIDIDGTAHSMVTLDGASRADHYVSGLIYDLMVAGAGDHPDPALLNAALQARTPSTAAATRPRSCCRPRNTCGSSTRCCHVRPTSRR
jgi:hypothetical protein